MSKHLEEELVSFGQWIDHNKPTIEDPQQALRFMLEAVDQMGWLVARVAKDLQKLEGRNPSGVLYTPSGFYIGDTAQR